jgi:hypothetical protein
MWPLYCLSLLDLRLLITPLVSCGRCIVCPSSINEFWLPLWYLVAIVFSVLPRFTTSDYPFGILWPLYCLSFLDFVLSVIPRFTTSDYPFGIFWPLYCLSFLELRLLITLLVSCGHCMFCPSSIYDFWLPLWCLLAIILSFPPRFTTSDYPFVILWPLYFLSFLDLRFLITPLVSCGHCIFCPSSLYDFWLPLWYLVAIALAVLPWFTTSDYPLVSCGHCIVCPSSIYNFWLPFWYLVVIVMSVLPRFMTSDYPFGILWPLYCLSFLGLRLLITQLVSCGHCIVCPSSIYDFWLPLWYLVAIVLSVLPQFTTSDYPFVILWLLYCLSFLDLWLLITPFVSCGHCTVYPSLTDDFSLHLWYLVAIVLSVPTRFTTSDYPFGSCGHWVVCPSSIYDFWLLLWYLVAILLSVLPRVTISDYPFGILWPLHVLSFLDLRLLITPLVSCGHCIVCRSWIYDLWLPIWYLVAIVLSVLLRFTTSGYPFGNL